jgi:hypothetical protein
MEVEPENVLKEIVMQYYYIVICHEGLSDEIANNVTR